MREFIDYFFEHKKFYLTLLFVLLLNLLFFVFFTLKEFNLYHNTWSQIEEVKKELSRTEREYKKFEQVSSNVLTVKKVMKTIRKKYMKDIDSDFPILTGKIYNILEKYNIDFQHISYNKKAIRSLGLLRVNIHIPIKTTYYNFRRCLSDLETMPFPVVIERISINSVEANSISATIDLLVYYKGKLR